MTMTSQQLWDRFKTHYQEFPVVARFMYVSRMNFPDNCLPAMAMRMKKSFAAMSELEKVLARIGNRCTMQSLAFIV